MLLGRERVAVWWDRIQQTSDRSGIWIASRNWTISAYYYEDLGRSPTTATDLLAVPVGQS